MLAGLGEPARAADDAKATFDHLKPDVRISRVTVTDGETFVVKITNTCPTAFKYTYAPLKHGKPSDLAALSEELIKIPHDDQYGGYLIDVSRRADGTSCEGSEKLEDITFVVSVDQDDWNVSFEGGFTFSGLTSPVYSVVPGVNGGPKQLIEEPDKRDEVRLGAASFVQVFHDRLEWKGMKLSLAFGLGINGDNRAEYLLGGAVKFGDKASLIGGLAWGSVARLPNGVALGPVTDDNVISNLGSQSVRSWFFGLSYSFVSTEAKGKLSKPFATPK